MARLGATVLLGVLLTLAGLGGCGGESHYQGGGRRQPSGTYGLPGADSGTFEGVDAGSDAGDAASE